jgi:hypothetical protein
MVFYDVDGNYIDVESMKDNNDNSLVAAYTQLWQRITHRRTTKPKMHILDNEASAVYKMAIEINCDLQLVPPDTHRQNLAKQAIQTFKSHFVAILAGVNENFSMYLWDRLLPQAVATLNVLQQSNNNPSVSAYEYVNGPFNYNSMLLAPLGCAVQVHEATNRQKTWDVHSLNGWYLGTSPEHYRCHHFFCKKTQSERILDTVSFQHRYLTIPELTTEDKIVLALGDIKSILLKRSNAIGKQEWQAIKQLHDIFQTSDVNFKKVTFKDLPPLPPGEVANDHGDISTVMPNIVATPRVLVNTNLVEPPRVVTAVIDKPLGSSTPQTKHNMRTRQAQKLQEIMQQQQEHQILTRNHAKTHVIDLEHAMTIMEQETANATFDEESGQVLKYRKLLTHPKYKEL